MQWYLKAFKNFANVQGRAHRKEYWSFFLINVLITVFLAGIETRYGIDNILTTVYGLLIFIPMISVSVRRIHDLGRSGWWVVLLFVPFLYLFLMAYFAFDGESGPNAYGPDPKTSS
ncbi:DUF805 domain-containing protein [Salisediminibacterium halotolerans]|uniref:DUF805 domain-containing protein n=1 Tax=Salisediminibacterium halotolerans TaxID=517425 RepID=UPI000F27D90C|nr:DUF805 domain-containing protein [Salisediminibacterium halotolerans]RLJ74393.1 uncharacterized membrane protein YhaH (DUF805 family) [Actinophytocola xinjiangensis]RPE87514.1 uncharacterized membrane protein YhaH (DUF805 family) [Salisediminibacterium halotolerans]TWG35230.1 uncharacterized membrane protein YhaH (DUF805 family) [Salisediminibacterium halotolerans]GEL08956.1 DUF805 domain-containing protein [Salisediminibacterium halotolerans]